MTTTDDVNHDIKRDRWGRYLIINGNGPAEPYTRATTVASTLSDTFALTKWRLRTMAVGLATRQDLYARVAACDPSDKRTLDMVCDDALEAGRASEGANFGTALHEAVARINRGDEVTMPAPWQPDLDAYRAALEKYHIKVLPDYVEKVCVLDELTIAGTFDCAVELPDGTTAIADLKTGQSLDYSWQEIAVQLALYAHADAIYDGRTAFRSDMPPVRQDRALVIHLPVGQATCELHMVDIEQGWKAAELAIATRGWRQHKNLALPFSHLGPPLAVNGLCNSTRARVEVIREMGFLDELATIWPVGVPGFKGEHHHTVDELDAIIKVVVEVEARNGIPF